jgi:hypothetical protein
MSTIESADTDMTTLYLAYDSYLMARQLALIIEGIDQVHHLVSYGDEFHRQQLSFPERARLRIERIDTGNSIELLFQAGQQITAELVGLGTVIVGGASMLAATTKLLVGAFSRIRVERQRTQLGEIAIKEAQRRLEVIHEQDAMAVRREQIRVSLEETLVELAKEKTALGLRTPEQLSELASKLERPTSSLDLQLNTGTLIQAALNGQDLVTARLPTNSNERPSES